MQASHHQHQCGQHCCKNHIDGTRICSACQKAKADLNAKPVLPFPDKSFDVVTCVVSFDYLTKPKEVMKEVARVLRPGGKLILSQSNRCFYTKAVGVWTADMSDAAHLRVLSTYIHFTDGLGTPKSLDISAKGPVRLLAAAVGRGSL